jgi:hypothetical protein
MIEEGWRQVKAGLALIVWSRLASWDAQTLSLTASKQTDFESGDGHKQIHGEFGRLICWIAFGVGAEYLTKGVCMLKGHDLSCDLNPILRLPLSSEDIKNWIQLVKVNDPSVREPAVGFGTLGTLPEKMKKILKPGPNQDLVCASIKLLASTIRNRDAHHYAQDVRAFHFHLVESLFVPAFNVLLASLNKDQLQDCLSKS